MSIKKSSFKKVFKSYAYFIKLQWKLSKVSILLVLLSYIIETVNTFVIVIFPGFILDCLAERMYRNLIYAVAAFSIWQFALSLVKSLIQRASDIQNEQVKTELNRMLVEKAISLRQEQLENPEIFERFEIARMCSNDCLTISFISSIFSFVFLAVELAGLLYILKSMPWWCIIIFVISTIIYAAANRFIAVNSINAEEEENKPNRIMRYFSYEVPKPPYAKEVRIFDLQPFVSQRHAETLEQSISVTRKYLKHISNAQQYARITDCLLSIFFYAFYIFRFAAGKLTVGMFSVSVNAVFRFSQTVNGIVARVINCSASGVRLSKIKDFLETKSLNTGTIKPPEYKENGIIEFVNVSYRYPGREEYVLKNINVRINLGEKLSIVGRNGAGKTTFISLMTGLYKPTQGKILYNGIDIETLDSEEYARLFSVVLQNYQIYGFTVLDNILLKENPSNDDISEAERRIDRIGLRGTVEKLPEKADTYITQRFNKDGTELSGGESQKLAIARMLKRNSDIYILDEPTASLSPQNEYEIYRRFDELVSGKTVIFISHRLSSCRLCDRILVFDNGEIAEDGNHDTLMKKNALYAEMFSKQAVLYA